MESPKETIAFCNAVQRALGVYRALVSVDLSQVDRVSSDALLLMRATIEGCKRANGGAGAWRIAGNLPTSAEVTAKFKASGFFSGFTGVPADLPEPRGMIRFTSRRRVEAQLAGDLIEFAERHASLSRSVAKASKKNLVELMLNTHTHATPAKARRKLLWSASVYCEGGIAHFSFVDLGVGITNSAAPRGFLRGLGVDLPRFGEANLLAKTFEGKIGASSHKAGRGWGLTRMVTDAQDGSLPALRVLTSRVTGKVSSLEFEAFGERFRGTIYRWSSTEASS